MDLKTFVEKWERSGAAEHSNSQSFLNDLCDVLGVARPQPATGDPAKDSYVFEKPVLLATEENASVGHVDLFKDGNFILEAKQGSNLGTKRIGTARRGTAAWNIAMRDAYGQALGYAQTLDDPPPFIITTDIGYCFEFYAAFDGSGHYRAFPNAQTNRVYLKTLLDPDLGPKRLDVLRAVFTDPHSLDPSRRATKVTREVAAHLAELARVLEEAGEPPERVARFLMRAIFTMFAENVGLLPEGLFVRLIEEHWLPNPPSFPGGIRSLWKAMNEGGDYFVGKLLRFNGGLFKDADAPPLKAEHLLRLQEAARCDWSEVEPAIFGTLLERALDPHERHRLGAHYTPRAYVERLVRPTVEEPLRAEWDLVRAEVRQLVEAGKESSARKAVRAFYDKLTHTRVLDPACGTGNFLYVTLDIFKRLETEVVALLGELEETQTIGEAAGYGVTPQQFLGIEVKPWAKEIAELVLWIGYLQWHFRTRGRVTPPEPVLQDYGNIEMRDAVLAYNRKEPVRDERGRPVSRWDGTTYKVSASGESVPDEAARVPVYKYIDPTPAKWPKADFIIGNPPFIGNKRMRLALGDGYVEALREAHQDVPDTSDFVMYWWNTAAKRVHAREVRAAGLITTNSITQTFNRKVVTRALEAKPPVSIVFAVPDHPWVDTTDGAAVRIAMTTTQPGSRSGDLFTVTSETEVGDGSVAVTLEHQAGTIQADLSIGPSVHAAKPLQANRDLSFQGIIPLGDGFRLTAEDLAKLGVNPKKPPSTIKRFVIGRDLVQKPEERYLIDFFGLTVDEARERFPALYQHILIKVKPERDLNRRDTRRKNWWLFGENAPKLRRAVARLSRAIATVETSKHKPFVFLPASYDFDHKVYVVASDDAFVLGVLSSRVHGAWAAVAGGTLEDRPTWTNTTCFMPFPFPSPSPGQIDAIRERAEKLDAHRKRQQAQHPSVTLTGMYNVLDKLRAGETLTSKEQTIHDEGLVTVLKQMHDELDEAVLNAYGWPADVTEDDILVRLVALNAERANEERRGVVRWLRPEFQKSDAAKRGAAQVALIGTEEQAAPKAAPAGAAAWPKKLHERIAAVRAVLADGDASWTVVDVSELFKGARRTDVEEVLQGLAALGLAVSFMAGGIRRWRAAGRLAA
jgi:hypothetical protein